jgi:RNA polymerase sigma factor (sigma-70 family)
MVPDSELLRRYGENGNQEAFAELVGRYIDLAYSAAVRVLGGASLLAPDVVQTVFITLSLKARPLSRHPTLAGWVHKSVRLAALDALRRERRRQAREKEADKMQENTDSTTGEWDQLRPILDEAIGLLRDRDRKAILLRFFQNKSHREIGGVLGVGDEAARKCVGRAVENLRAAFARRGVAISSVSLAAAISAHSVEVAPVGLSSTISGTVLAGASPGGTAVAVGILKFMSINKTLTAVAGAIALAIIGFGVYENNQTRKAESELTALREENNDLQARFKSLENSHFAGQQGALGEGAAKAPSASAKPVRKPVQISDIIKDHPEFAKLYREATRRQLTRIYGDGLNSLNLPPRQLDRLKGLLTERQMNIVDAEQAANLAGLSNASPEWQRAVNQASLIDDQEIKEILGPNADATLADMMSNVGKARVLPSVQSQVYQIASDFVDGGVPLTTDQSAGLAQALLNNAYWPGRDLSDRPVDYNDTDPTTGLSPHDVSILTSAAQVLTPDQLSDLRSYEIQTEQILAIQHQYGIPIAP